MALVRVAVNRLYSYRTAHERLPISRSRKGGAPHCIAARAQRAATAVPPWPSSGASAGAGTASGWIFLTPWQWRPALVLRAALFDTRCAGVDRKTDRAADSLPVVGELDHTLPRVGR